MGGLLSLNVYPSCLRMFFEKKQVICFHDQSIYVYTEAKFGDDVESMQRFTVNDELCLYTWTKALDQVCFCACTGSN